MLHDIDLDEAYKTQPTDLPTPQFDENAMRVLTERYFAKKTDGTLETPSEFLWRVAYAIAKPDGRAAVARLAPVATPGDDADAEASAEARAGTEAYADFRARIASSREFYKMMAARDFLPNTPCLVNAGRPLSMLSACFVLSVPDSMDGIFDAIKSQALIQKAGGGTGMAFSRLRGQGAPVRSTGKASSGPLAFMKVFDSATDSIKQSGIRRGANMGVLSVDHPDIFEFMACKKELDSENRALFNRLSDSGLYSPEQLARTKQELLQTQFSNFNISIGISNAFMAAVKADGDFDLRDPMSGDTVRTVKAREIWDAIVEGAWQNGEPGVLFLEHPDANPLPGLGPIEASNPCGEQLLHGGDSCNLGSINVGNYIVDGEIDWDRIQTTTHTAVRFLDNVIDENLYTEEHIGAMVRANRRIGLGIMGFADMLAKLKIDYGTPEAIDLARTLMERIKIAAVEASEKLAIERGEFPNKHLSVYAQDDRPRRNAALLSIAPTGTISMIAGCSFGCEPWFAIAYVKKVMKDSEGRPQSLYYKTPAFEEAYRAAYCTSVPDDVYAEIAENGGSIRGLNIDGVGAGFAVTADVSVDGHIDMLAAFQRHTCNSVSKTVNAPNNDTRENVARAIMRAFDSGCKGFTYYRDGSRTEQVVNIGNGASSKTDASTTQSVAAPTDIEALLVKAQAVLAK